MLGYVGVSGLIIWLAVTAFHSLSFGGGWLIGGIIILGLLGQVLFMLVVGVLSAFVRRAAIYFYATTGKSPAMFDKRLLRVAFTAKKARKIFTVR